MTRGHCPGEPGQKRRQDGMGRARGAVRPADLVHMQQAPARRRRSRRCRAGRLAAARRSGTCAAGSVPHAQTIPDEQAGTAEHDLLAAERSAALREAFLHLPLSCQRLITTLTENPPAPCAQISAKLGIPVAGIGPTRNRCLDELRRHPAIAALIHAEAETARRVAGPDPSRRRPEPSHRPSARRWHRHSARGCGRNPRACRQREPNPVTWRLPRPRRPRTPHLSRSPGHGSRWLPAPYRRTGVFT